MGDIFRTSGFDDKLAIREVVENWVIWRDSGQWDRFRTLWHDGARFNATWFSGSVDDFIANARRSFERGAIGCHFLGGSSIEIAGSRAIAQTKKRIDSRQTLDGIVCDV